MSVLAKPVNRMARISSEESAAFISRFNAGVPKTEQQLKSYESARKLFTRNGKAQI